MWNPFKRQPKIVSPGTAEFQRVDEYVMSFERQRLPDPGAMVYSWETLQLAQFSPIGAGVAVRRHLRETDAPVFVSAPAVWVNGLPTVPGQFVHAPLLQQVLTQ